ncbi:MAG: hypothetical protein KGV59_06055 [Tenacibaculum sp.]|nr:hypothetical protein [Tenacibaculum sp.]
MDLLKLDKLKKNGLELLLYLISGVLIFDLINVNTKIELEEKFNHLNGFVIIKFIIIFLSFLYFTKFLRPIVCYFLYLLKVKIEEILSIKTDTLNEYREYYRLYELKEQAIMENNGVKLNIYNDIKLKKDKIENIKNLCFMIIILIPLNIYLDNTILDNFQSNKVVIFSLVFLWLICFFYGLQNIDYDKTYIRREPIFTK